MNELLDVDLENDRKHEGMKLSISSAVVDRIDSPVRKDFTGPKFLAYDRLMNQTEFTNPYASSLRKPSNKTESYYVDLSKKIKSNAKEPSPQRQAPEPAPTPTPPPVLNNEIANTYQVKLDLKNGIIDKIMQLNSI